MSNISQWAFIQSNLKYNGKIIPSILQIARTANTLAAIVLLLYSFGSFSDDITSFQLFSAFNWILLIYFLVYLIRLFLSLGKPGHLKNHIFETVFLLIIITCGFDGFISGNSLDSIPAIIPNLQGFHFWMVVIFISSIISFEVFRGNFIYNLIKARPFFSIMISFLILIAIGTVLLSFPAMTKGEKGMPILDALFTATSASCVTGLIVEDTATYFSLRGQFVIMVLIQLGGLGILFFATYYSALVCKKTGIGQHSVRQDRLNNFYSSPKSLFKSIFLVTMLIESIIFLGIYLNWGSAADQPANKKLFDAIFHAISAFCNAGFSTLSENLNEPLFSSNYMLHMVIILAVILGGLGFMTLNDLFSPARLRDRLAHPWKDWEVGTKIAVFTTLGLLLAGMVGFILFEYQNTLSNFGLFDIAFLSFFQSATTRSAGFHTVDISALSESTLLLFIILMFIGASSGSVGGGIKTSTFFLIIFFAVATLRRRSKLVIGKREIPKSSAHKALTIFFWAVFFNLVGLLVLSITEPGVPFIELAFEQFSAFGTVGLSTGVTTNLSDPGKVIILISMYIGRVGPLLLALTLIRGANRSSDSYSGNPLMIG